VCRTTGATNLRFISAPQEATGPTDIHGNRQLDMNPLGGFTVAKSRVEENPALLPVFDPTRTPIFQKVAPGGEIGQPSFVHPVDALKRYLPTHPVTQADHGLGRVTGICLPEPPHNENCANFQNIGTVDNPSWVPISEYGGAGIVQPTQGAGATWLKREFVTTDGQNQQ
jgi:hypothetical protein